LDFENQESYWEGPVKIAFAITKEERNPEA